MDGLAYFHRLLWPNMAELAARRRHAMLAPMSEKADSVVYRSDVAHGLVGWDVMEVVHLRGEQILSSFVIARHPDGTILRRTTDGTIILTNKWEEVTDEEDLQHYQKYFADRDT